MKRLTLIVFNLIVVLTATAQIIEPIKWAFDSRQDGRDVELIFKADIEKTGIYTTPISLKGARLPHRLFLQTPCSLNLWENWRNTRNLLRSMTTPS